MVVVGSGAAGRRFLECEEDLGLSLHQGNVASASDWLKLQILDCLGDLVVCSHASLDQSKDNPSLKSDEPAKDFFVIKIKWDAVLSHLRYKMVVHLIV